MDKPRAKLIWRCKVRDCGWKGWGGPNQRICPLCGRRHLEKVPFDSYEATMQPGERRKERAEECFATGCPNPPTHDCPYCGEDWCGLHFAHVGCKFCQQQTWPVMVVKELRLLKEILRRTIQLPSSIPPPRRRRRTPPPEQTPKETPRKAPPKAGKD